MSYKEEWKIPKLEIKKGEWYVCTNDWSDDGWCKFAKGDVVQADEDGCFVDCYGNRHSFTVDAVCYFRPADKDEIPEKYRLKDIELTEFEKALYEYGVAGEDFICSHDGIEIKHETRRIANELLGLARRQLEPEIRRKVRHEASKEMPCWQYFPSGAAGGTDRDVYLIRSSRGNYHTSKCIAAGDRFLVLKDLEKLPGIPSEER